MTKNKNNKNKRSNGKNSQAISTKNGLHVAPLAVSKNIRSHEMRTRLQEKERFTNIPGNAGFAVVASHGCNPGIYSSFPWLSTIASNYDKYIFHKLVYRYRTLKGTTNPGNIIVGFDYDTQDLAPVDALGMTQLGEYSDGAVWDVFELHVPCENNERYIRGASVGGDKKLYDMGRLFVSAESCTDTSDQGYMEVEYDVTLLHKNNNVSRFGSSLIGWFQGGPGVDLVGIGQIVPWQKAVIPNGIGYNAGVFQIPKGNWLVIVTVHISGNAITSPSARFLLAAPDNTASGVAASYLDVATPGIVGSGTGTFQLVVYSTGSPSGFYVENVGSSGYYMPGEYRSITFQPV